MKKAALVLSSLVFGASCFGANAEPIPPGAVSQNVEVVAYTDLGDKPAFKMSITQADGHWYLYVGHRWHSGWSIIDVTEPTQPKVVKFIPGPKNTWTGQMELSGTTMVTSMERKPKEWGGNAAEPFDEGVLIWDIRDHLNPKQVGHYKTGTDGPHRIWYAGGRYMHLATYLPGFTDEIYVIVDISDPAHPTEAGRWWVKGQAKGETPPPPEATWLHGPPFVSGHNAFLPYGGAGMYIVDISDVKHPKEIGHLSYSPPFIPYIAVHTVVPLPDRHIAITNSEATIEDCAGPLNQASIVDIRDLSKPRLIAMLPLPIPSPAEHYRNYCEKGGRFGPHNQNTLLHNPDVQKEGDLLYLTYFNAGLRIFDIGDPQAPREVGFMVPPDPRKRYGAYPKSKLVTQTEDVLVDRRGYIYITDANQGLYVLKYAPHPTR
jgi:hypothetical protein